MILGDMNIEDSEELASILPTGFVSLNGNCIPTNTNPNGPKPYDHVVYNTTYRSNEMGNCHFQVIDLVGAMKQMWNPEDGVFPGEPYEHKEFRMRYSDHHPISFVISLAQDDD